MENKPIRLEPIKLIDIYKYDPWDLPKASDLVGISGTSFAEGERNTEIAQDLIWSQNLGICRRVSHLHWLKEIAGLLEEVLERVQKQIG